MSTPSPLFILAFDHRVVLRSMYPAATDPQFIESKMLVLDAVSLAIERGAADCGYLVDEEYGATAALEAKQRGITLAMPVEASRTPELMFQYGDLFDEHIEKFEPDIVKTLVFHSAGDAPDRKDRQVGLLTKLRDWCSIHDFPLMVEILIARLVAEPSPYAHDDVLAAELIDSITDLQARGIEADIWKIDGLDDEGAAANVVLQAEKQGRSANTIVLGTGASMDRVERWVDNAGRIAGYDGFAVGRSVWKESLGAFFEGSMTRGAAVSAIASTYGALVRRYLDAESRRVDAG